MDKKRSAPAIFGACSLLVIFSVLCLIVFALLSLSTANAGKKLSVLSADQVQAYYSADTKAQETLAALRSGETPEGVSVEGSSFSYVCPISDVLSLFVEGEWEADGSCTVIRWQSVRTASWEADQDIDVWDPNNE